MEQFYVLNQLQVNIELNPVMHALDCAKDSPVYEEFQEEYESIYQEMLALAEPVGILGIGTLSQATKTEEYPAGTKVIYAVLSIGDGIKQCSTKAFQEGDYVRGMLCDAMADSALFSLENSMLEMLREICAEHGVGILKRLEAPHDISMEVQREAWDYLSLKDRFGIDISCGYMFDPVKTSCQIFVLTENTDVFKAQHDCRKCSNVKCKMRNIPDIEVTVRKGSEIKTVMVRQKESLMEALLREGYYISAVCGGTGRCGKCRIRVLEGKAVISTEDKKFFSQKELAEGWRLSCMLYPTEDLAISFELKDESDFEIVSDYQAEQVFLEKTDSHHDSLREYEIAIDIGTTTLAFQLIDRKSKDIHSTVTTINSQRKYGADVISRIQASMDGRKEELRESMQNDLKNGIQKLLAECEVSQQQLVRIVIGCNTTMGHLLMGYDCDSLGVYPFTPVNVSLIRGTMQEILKMDGNAEVELLPGISTYVGGDIVSGLYACDFDKSDDICLLVDLGTNGEMALGNRSKILVTSTAAGPAFEGGNIEWGTGSVAGAIRSVKIKNKRAQVQTIMEKAPIGICGTGVIETVAELLREGLLDETGLLDEDYFDEGFPLSQTMDGQEIVLTQKDIRELQLAKAAVRAGIETLLFRYGIQKEQVARVYLAGGFGYRLDTQKAIAIGMLPAEFADCTQAVGNSCLAGTIKYLRQEQGEETLQKLVDIAEEINLSADKDFNEIYMDAMMFEA